MQVEMKHFLKGGLPIRKEEIDAFTTQARLPDRLRHSLSHAEYMHAEFLIKVAEKRNVRFGLTMAWPGVTGPMVMSARTRSSSNILLAGASSATILQKMQRSACSVLTLTRRLRVAIPATTRFCNGLSFRLRLLGLRSPGRPQGRRRVSAPFTGGVHHPRGQRPEGRRRVNPVLACAPWVIGIAAPCFSSHSYSWPTGTIRLVLRLARHATRRERNWSQSGTA